MRNDIVLGGYVIDAGGFRRQLAITSNPDELTAKNVIENVSGVGKGVVVMRCKSPPEYGPYELEVHIDSGNFLLMLNENDEGGDHRVRTLNNECASREMVVVLGEIYPAKVVARDMAFVCSVLFEFALSGNVSADRLN